MYLFLYVPIVLVVVYAFNKNRDVGLWTGFTTHWFGDALGDSQYTSALETSAKIALLSSFFATILGTAAALALARMRKAARAPFDVLVYLTLVVPEIVIAVASLIFFVQAHQRVGRLIPGQDGSRSCRPHGVQHLARHADRAGALRRHGLDARGGQLRPGRGAARNVPAGHAAAPPARRSSPASC